MTHPEPTPANPTEILADAVADQPDWTLNHTNGYAHRLHGRHLAVVQIAAPDTTVDWTFSVRDVLTGHTTVHSARTGPAWSLLEELNVALAEADRKHTERARADRP